MSHIYRLCHTVCAKMITADGFGYFRLYHTVIDNFFCDKVMASADVLVELLLIFFIGFPTFHANKIPRIFPWRFSEFSQFHDVGTGQIHHSQQARDDGFQQDAFQHQKATIANYYYSADMTFSYEKSWCHNHFSLTGKLETHFPARWYRFANVWLQYVLETLQKLMYN